MPLLYAITPTFRSFSLSFLRRSTRSAAKPSSCSLSLRSLLSFSNGLVPLPTSSVAASPMGDRCLLVLFSKSPEESALAESLRDGKVLKLRDGGEEIAAEVALQRSDDVVSSFRMQKYMEGLRASTFGRLLIWTPVITSTHDLLQQNFEEIPVGSVCLADVQSKGRGRVSNAWESPVGCLMFSYSVQMVNGRVLPLLQYVVSLAVTESVKDICLQRGLPHLDVKIKWPNDIYLKGLKVGGISCNSTYKSGKFNVSIGVGLNLDNEKPTTCLNTILQELTSRPYRLEREEILAAFLNKFEVLFETFLKQGFAALEDLYYNTWLHSEQRITIEEKQEDQPTKKCSVTIRGLTSSGYLLATDDDDNSYELHPDGSSLDFFEGLARRKLS